MDKRFIKPKCENCGSRLIFDPEQGLLRCISCDSNYILPKKDDSAVLIRQYSPKFQPSQLNKKLIAYKCENCGNITYMSSDEHSNRCFNCGGLSSAVVQDSGICADGIIPFKISKKEAAVYFQKYLKKKWGIPKELKNYASNQKLTGIYVPVWNFTFDLSATYHATIEETYTSSSGESESHFREVYGDRFKHIKSMDESANSNESSVFLNLFDEDDYSDIIPYRTEYTYGFRVDNIDRDIHEYYGKILGRAEMELEEEIRSSLSTGNKTVTNIELNANAHNVFFNFAYVPVYVNTFKKKNKVYKTYISGTTGKVVGKSPRSFLKILLSVLGPILIVGGVIALIYFLNHNF